MSKPRIHAIKSLGEVFHVDLEKINWISKIRYSGDECHFEINFAGGHLPVCGLTNESDLEVVHKNLTDAWKTWHSEKQPKEQGHLNWLNEEVDK